ncbi:MAG: PDZ domain-containing protein [Planctomycetota bacterium]|jgi:tetratricopeptide (TPR) repeat protein
MRRFVIAFGILLALCLTAMPLAVAGPEDSEKKSGSQIDELEKELEKLQENIDKALARIRKLRGEESGTDRPQPKPMTQQKAQEVQQLWTRAMQLIQGGQYKEAIPVHRKLVAEMEEYGLYGQQFATAYYNLACCLALTGEKDEAFDALIRSVEEGFVDFEHITKDTDLDSLHDDPRWEKMLSKKDDYIEKARRRATQRQRPGSGPGMPGQRRGMGNPAMQKLQAMAQKAMELLQDRKLDEAIEAYIELLDEAKKAGVSGTGLAVHYYNLACAYSLNKNIDKAFKTLIQSVENGYVDFSHMDQDTDLNNMHDDKRWEELFSKKDEYIEKAQDKILEGFTKRFDAEDYLKDFDKEHNIIYMTNLGKGTLGAMKSQLNEYADLQWKGLFRHQFSRPLAILCLARADFAKLAPRGVGGFYQPANHVLVVPELSYTLIHEFTHALHNADQQRRRQTHPLWITEGLATLFETSVIKEDKIDCLLNPRLEVLRRAIKSGQAPGWDKFMEAGRGNFMRNASLNYAYTRYIFYYLWEKGILKDWYEAYSAGYKHDKTGKRAFEYVLNKKLEEAEKEWQEWVLAKPTAPSDMSVGRAFFGVGTEETDDGLKVINVVEGTGAEKAGLKVGDFILEFEGEKIESREVFMKSIQARRVGDKINVKVKREEEVLSLDIELTGRPANLARRPGGGRAPSTQPRPGRGETPRLDPGNLRPTIGARFRDTEDGVEIRSVFRNSTGAQAGLKAGDIIIEFDGEDVTDRAKLEELIGKCKLGDKVSIIIEREGEAIDMDVEIGGRMNRRSRQRGGSVPEGQREPEQPKVRRGAQKK